MVDVLERVDVSALLAAAHNVVDDMQAADLTAVSDDCLLDHVREFERLQRRLTSVGYALIGEVDSRALPSVHGARTMAAFLSGLLRIDTGEAHGRAKAAAAAGPRRGLTGEPLEPVFPEVAAAQAEGAISQAHARIIVSTVDKLPDDAQADHGAEVERDLVGFARSFPPRELDRIACKVRDCYDPDGVLDDHKRRERERDLTVHARPDGSATLTGDLTAEATERLLTVLDALGAPKNTPAVDGVPAVKDPRSAGQRRHDALLSALNLLALNDALPKAGGVSATIVVTMTDEAYRTGAGLARLGHGALIPTSEALRMGGGDLRLLAVAIDDMRGITAYSNSQRLFTETQRLAIAARDRGCTFPGCDTAPGLCECHHINEFAAGGPTSVDNGTLLCRYHHHNFEQLGWACVVIDGRVYWRPPKWLDTAQRPIRNRLHDPG